MDQNFPKLICFSILCLEKPTGIKSILHIKKWILYVTTYEELESILAQS